MPFYPRGSGIGGPGGGGGFAWEPVGEWGTFASGNSRTNFWYGATPAIDMGNVVFLENELLAVVKENNAIYWVQPGDNLNQIVSSDLKPIKSTGAANTRIQFAYLSATVYYCGRAANDEFLLGTTNFNLTGKIRLFRTKSQILV